MIERRTVIPSREELISALESIVNSVKIENPDLLGVILFGRRAHEDQPDQSSDVDLIVVRKGNGYASLAVSERLRECFPQVRFDLSSCIIDLVERALENPLSLLAANYRRSPLQHLDKDCFFLLDPITKETIVRLTGCDQKSWSRI